MQCSYNDLTALIQFVHFVSLFRVLVHAKIFSLQMAEQSIHKHLSAVQVAKPYPYTKNLHPSDSHSRYPAMNGLYVHKQLCLSIVLVSLFALKWCNALSFCETAVVLIQ